MIYKLKEDVTVSMLCEHGYNVILKNDIPLYAHKKISGCCDGGVINVVINLGVTDHKRMGIIREIMNIDIDMELKPEHIQDLIDSEYVELSMML